jgi:hypothetical protein
MPFVPPLATGAEQAHRLAVTRSEMWGESGTPLGAGGR